MKSYEGYRTYVVAVLLFAAPLLARWGLKIDAQVVADAMLVIAPAAMALMRSITRVPAAGARNAN